MHIVPDKTHPTAPPTAPMGIAMTTLEVRDLSVEAGGKTVVEGLSFTLHAGDKMGVVGRNGAGKTSTLKVLAGEAPAAGGRVAMRARSGTCARIPDSIVRTTPPTASPTSCRRVSSPTWRTGSRSTASSSRRIPPSATSGGSPDWRRSTSAPVATRPNRRPARPRPASGSPRVAWGSPWGRLGGRTQTPRAGSVPLGGSDLLLLDEPTNHLDVDAKVWLMKFLASYKGALMVVSHDIGLLDASITRSCTSMWTGSWSTEAPTPSTGRRGNGMRSACPPSPPGKNRRPAA